MGAQISSGLTEESTVAGFALKLYKAVSDGDKNIILSPYSISAALLLADLGAKGTTEEEIRHALGFKNLHQEELHSKFMDLRTCLSGDTKGTATLVTANRIYSKLGLKIDPTFVHDCAKYHGSGLELLDFEGDPEGCRNIINKWAEELTRNKIHNLLPSGSINPETVMILVNAIYFKGKWLEPFEIDRTMDVDFHVTLKTTVKVKMMKDKREVHFHRDNKLKCSAVELPYKDGYIKMIFIRPFELDGLNKLEVALTPSKFEALLNTIDKSYMPEVILGIPKFKMEATYSLVETLATLGIKAMFNAFSADFTKMLPETARVFVSAVIHQAFIEINEEGTEAAAATAFVTDCLGSKPRPPEQFILDHPFIFVIRDAKSGTVIFMGSCRQPTR